jgi:hypothetical protein
MAINNRSVSVETHSFRDGNAEVRIGASIVNGTIRADRLVVEYNTGNTEDVLIFPINGKRQVVRVKKTMSIQTPTPAVSAQATFGEELESAPVEPDHAQELLAIYDLFEGRSNPEDAPE